MNLRQYVTTFGRALILSTMLGVFSASSLSLAADAYMETAELLAKELVAIRSVPLRIHPPRGLFFLSKGDQIDNVVAGEIVRVVKRRTLTGVDTDVWFGVERLSADIDPEKAYGWVYYGKWDESQNFRLVEK